MESEPGAGGESDFVRQQLERAKKTAIQRFLSKEARERLASVRTAHPDLAEKVELAVLNAVQGGNLKSEINEEQLKEILDSLAPKKQGFRILR